MRMREAGVAGAVPRLPCLAMIAGEADREPGLGGGGISDNRGSGDMESFSEPSRPRGTSRLLEFNCDDRASSLSSLISFGGTTEERVPFRLCDFTIGDCRTRPLLVAGRDAFFRFVLLSLLVCSCEFTADSFKLSTSK